MSPGNGTRWVGKSFPSRGSSRHNTRLSSKRRNGLWERPLRKEHRTGEQVHRDLRHRPPDETRRHHAPAPPSGKPNRRARKAPQTHCRKEEEPGALLVGVPATAHVGEQQVRAREAQSRAPAPLPGTCSRETEAGVHAKPVQQHPSSTARGAHGGATPLSRPLAAGTEKCGASAGKTTRWAVPLSETSAGEAEGDSWPGAEGWWGRGCFWGRRGRATRDPVMGAQPRCRKSGNPML